MFNGKYATCSCCGKRGWYYVWSGVLYFDTGWIIYGPYSFTNNTDLLENNKNDKVKLYCKSCNNIKNIIE